MVQQKMLTLLEQSIQAKAGTVSPDQVLAELNGWDSMGMVMLVGETFDQLQVELSIDDLQRCVTVGDLVGLVAAKAAG